MKLKVLAYKNIIFHIRYYRLVAIATLITVAVIVGSLAVGDSVRATLVKRVAERLGDAQTIVFSRNAFIDEKLAGNPLFGNTARGILLTNGFISQNGNLIPVFVWGVNDLSIDKGVAKINSALLKELGQDEPDAIVLRLPASGVVPSGSLFVTENYTTSMRLDYEGIVGVEDGGNISMRNEQIIPFNVFVNRQELAEAIGAGEKINLILTEKLISSDELEQAWHYHSSGLYVERREGFTEITSDRIFLHDEVVETICENNSNPNRLFSYLANSIQHGGASIPYSFVTAADSYKGRPLQNNDVILSDYSAKRLNAKQGDKVAVTYFTSHDFKTLQTDTVTLRVKDIVPLNELLGDKTLSADYPGLTDVERCTDWDSDLPINMELITGEDERYWELYRSAPKAIIAYRAVAGQWGNAYGNATSVRVQNTEPNLSALTPEMFGISVIHPRAEGVYAAANGVNFSSLFLALGFFIIISAILLMLVPISEMLYQRRHEIDLLKALGYTKKRIARLLWRESAPVVIVSSVAGVMAGLLYTVFIMWLLGNLWRGATHTGGFSVYPSVTAVIPGFVAGIALLLIILYVAIVRNLKDKKWGAETKALLPKRKKTVVIVSTFIAAAIVGVNFFYGHTMLFVATGIILTGTAAVWGYYLIRAKRSVLVGAFGSGRLVWSALWAGKKQAALSFFSLSTGVFIVFSVGLNRKGFTDSLGLLTGTGGFSLWCESTVPVYHNMLTGAGREKLSLTALPADAEILQCFRYGADDASCLNLNRVTAPTVLGLDMNALETAGFSVEQNILGVEADSVFGQMQKHTGGAYPALIDATVLKWGLMKNLGDTLWYGNGSGQAIPVRLVGTLANSVFQGNILINRSSFSEIWPETTGSEVFIIKTKNETVDEVKALLSQALSEYGVRVSTTADRLKQFNTVTDTYLTIFMTLGSLGLLLGIVSFIVVIRKNLTTRRREIELYRTLGFTVRKIEQTLCRENLLVPVYAIAAGVLSALVGVGQAVINAGAAVWLLAFLFAAAFVASVFIFVKKVVRDEIARTAV